MVRMAKGDGGAGFASEGGSQGHASDGLEGLPLDSDDLGPEDYEDDNEEEEEEGAWAEEGEEESAGSFEEQRRGGLPQSFGGRSSCQVPGRQQSEEGRDGYALQPDAGPSRDPVEDASGQSKGAAQEHRLLTQTAAEPVLGDIAQPWWLAHASGSGGGDSMVAWAHRGQEQHPGHQQAPPPKPGGGFVFD